MDKNTLLQNVTEKINLGEISKEEILNLFKDDKHNVGEDRTNKIVNILYTIGGLIVLVGLFFFFSQFWSEMSMFTKIFSTMGFGLAAFIVALLVKSREQNILASTLFILSAIFIPFGIGVYLSEVGIEMTSTLQAILFTFLTITFLVAYYVSKRNILILISMIFGILSYATTINSILLNFDPLLVDTIEKWALMLISIAYGGIAYLISKTNSIDHKDKNEKEKLSGIVYFFSVIGLIVPFFGNDLGTDLVALLILFGLFYVSVYVKSTSMLISTSIMFIIYLSSVLIEYFSDNFGMSLIIILIGLLIIGIGFVAFRINSKYLKV